MNITFDFTCISTVYSTIQQFSQYSINLQVFKLHHRKKYKMMAVVIFWMALLFDLSQSSQLYACDDEIFENELKANNWICKLDKDYDVMAVPRPFPQKLNSTIQIYEVSGVDEGGHTLTIHFKHYIQWTDKRLSYHNRSA